MNKYQDLIDEQAKRDATPGKLVTIVTKPVKTPFVDKASETFKAIILPEASIHGVDKSSHIRVLKDTLRTEVLRIDRIESIDGKPLEAPKNEWVIEGSKGNKYVVTRNADVYNCTCPGFMYRSKCKHVDKIKEKNDG